MKEYLESEEFYSLMQDYRNAPITDQDNVVGKFEKIKSEIGNRFEAYVKPKITVIKENTINGLLTDGAHHKQNTLELILGLFCTEKEYAYLKEKHEWEDGIPA